MNNRWTRRDFLKTVGATTLGAFAAGSPKPAFANEVIVQPEAKADCLIVLWMGGGMAHTETFDPKRYTPFEPGIEANRILSTFPSIPTAIDGVQFSDRKSVV